MKILIIIILFLLVGCNYPFIPIVEGDCVDRAFEIRSSLREQGYEAEIVFGMVDDEGHAWVKYRDKKTGEWRVIKNLWTKK